MENTNMNIPVLTISEAVAELTKLYVKVIKKKVDFKKLLTPFLWGAPGVGKSMGIKELAHNIEYLTGKKVIVIDVSIPLYTPTDLHGFPSKSNDGQHAVWLRPQIFDFDESEDTINILFLDELSAAPQSVQTIAYQICLDRRIGEHKLADNCIVIAAGNRTTDRSVAYKMSKALCNRLMHYQIEPSLASWKRWAAKNGVDERIIGYLAFDNSKLCVEPGSSDIAYATPRIWEKVGNLLNLAEGNISEFRVHLCASLGVDTCIEFENWCKVYEDLPSTEEILGGVCRKYPKTHDALHALTTGLYVALRREKDTLTDEQLNNVCTYVSRFPKDFAAMFFKDLDCDYDFKFRLMKVPAFNRWLSQNSDFVL